MTAGQNTVEEDLVSVGPATVLGPVTGTLCSTGCVWLSIRINVLVATVRITTETSIAKLKHRIHIQIRVYSIGDDRQFLYFIAKMAKTIWTFTNMST